MRWTVTTLGLSESATLANHRRAVVAWDDYHKRVRDLEADGYRRRHEASQYGWQWTRTLTLGDSRVTIRLEAESELAAPSGVV